MTRPRLPAAPCLLVAGLLLTLALIGGETASVATAQPPGFGGERGDREGRGGPGGERGERGGPRGAFGERGSRGDRRGGRGPGGGGFGGFGGGAIFEREVVQKELKLTDNQIEELKEARPDMSSLREEGMRMFTAGSDEERAKLRDEMMKKVGQMQAESEKKYEKIMNTEQFARYSQLSLQQQGLMAIAKEEIQKKLGVSDDQKKKLEEFASGMRDRFRDVFRMSREDREAELNKLAGEAFAILTPEQRQTWDKMLGKPLEGFDPGPGGMPGLATGQVATDDAKEKSETAKSEGDDDETEPPKPATIAMPKLTDAPRVASFGTPQPEAGGAAAEPSEDDLLAMAANILAGDDEPAATNPGGATRTLQFNFSNAPWSDVLTLFAESANLTLDMETTPDGAFTYFDPATYSPTEALDILNGYLIPRGFVLLRRDKFLVVRKIGDKISPDLVPTVIASQLDSRGDNELVRTIFDTGSMQAGDFVEDVENLLGPQGSAVALGTSNRIVVQGLNRNLKQVAEFLSGTVRPPKNDEMTFAAFPLRHIQAADVEPLARTLLGVGTAMTAEADKRKSRDPREAFAAMIASKMGGGKGGSSKDQAEGTARVTIDARTNALLVTATPPEIEIVRQMVEQVDVADGQTAGDRGGPRVQMYRVESGDIDEIAETLTAVVPGASINVDGRNEKLHVIATDAVHREVAMLLRELTGESAKQLKVIPLARMDAVSAANLVESLYLGESNRPSMQSDPTGRRLIVRGSADQILTVEQMLQQLGESGQEGSRGRVRTIPLNGQDGERTARMLQQLFESRGGTVRVINPAAPTKPGAAAAEAPTQPETPKEDAEVNNAGPQPISTFDEQPASTLQGQPTWYVAQVDDDDEEAPATEKAAAPSVSIVVQDDNLVITSADESQLDTMESLADLVVKPSIAMKQWSVIYLSTVTAEAAATFLGQIFPDALVLGEGKVLVSSSSVVSNRELMIVPEPNANALYLSGTETDLAQVQDVLRLYDSLERPESARDRLPRSIDVEHADLGTVYDIVKAVYSDKLPQTTVGRDGRPSGQTPGQMTLGVDDTTSTLIVSSDQKTYDEIAALVASLDEDARAARRSVRVVQLRNTDAASVENLLGTLLPKVSFSTSSTRTSSSRSRGGDNDSSSRSEPSRPESSSSDDEERRQRIREFFESRRGQGGGFGPPGGGPFGDRGGDRGGFGRGDRGRDGRGR